MDAKDGIQEPFQEPSSYKDPDAKVFYKDGKVYRKISEKYSKTYKTLMESGLYDELVSKNLLIKHKEIQGAVPGDGKSIIINPEKVFISYPWEWCFSELKDAALATLEIQKVALKYNMTLKDATPFNIQFLDNKPLLIDTSSFEEFNNRPWSAYRQFCECFLSPLALIAYTDLSLISLFLGNINGIPLDLASKLLPLKTKFNPNLLMHIHIHSKIQEKYSKNDTKINPDIKKEGLLNIIENLISTTKSITLSKYKTEWAGYYSDTNYTDSAFNLKKEIITSFKNKISPKTVWDFGANTGVFSKIFSECAKVTAFDIDPLAIEKLYLEQKDAKNSKSVEITETGARCIFPLVFDLVNPSPALGFNNEERKTLNQRAEGVDLTLALALIHHLRITYNVPFSYAAEYFSQISKYLIIEFVDKEDSKIQTMLKNRKDIFDDYTENCFEAEFGEFYKILEKMPIAGTKRTLYLMEKYERNHPV